MGLLAQESGGWFGFDSILWLTVLVILVATIAGAILRRLRKDKCLKLFDGHHATWLGRDGRLLWGDVRVTSQGIELVYDAPFTTRRGLIKTSHLLFPDEWAGAIALGRTLHGLTEEERAAREAQIRRTFDPGPVRRLVRSIRNFVDLLRDGLNRAFGVFLGSLAARGSMGAALKGGRGEVDSLGQSIVGAFANAYEPLLERHIGRPVVVEFANAEGASEPTSQFPGYLVDYTENFLAVFNVEHTPEEVFELESEGEAQRPGLRMKVGEHHVRISCEGPEALVVRRFEAGGTSIDLGVTLLPGTVLSLARKGAGPARVIGERTRRIDLVCPRSHARVRFGSDRPDRAREKWSGVAPETGE